MNPAPIELDPQVMRTGLKRAMTRGRDTLLCVVGPVSIRFIGISGLRMMVSWEHPTAGPSSSQFFVFPPLAIHLLTSALGQELSRITLSTTGRNTVLGMADAHSQYEMRWRADLRQFLAPPEFTQMLAVPKGIITISYLSLSDAAHQAVANLVNLQSMQNVTTDKLAILMDFSSSRLTLDGRTIVNGASGAYYFDPRLLIRALEIIKSNTLRVGMMPLPVGHRAVLTLLADQDGWHVQCALLSVGADTQKLFPLPQERFAAGQRRPEMSVSQSG
jgi:hypothetical protein